MIDDSIAVARRGVDNGEFKLRLVGAQLDKEVENFVYDFFGTRAGTVDLVEHNKGLFAQSEGFFQHEAGLGHAALKGVDKQNYAVDHLKDTLDLAAEVSVPGRVYDIDLGAVVHYGCGL